jgi:hypothetical protein
MTKLEEVNELIKIHGKDAVIAQKEEFFLGFHVVYRLTLGYLKETLEEKEKLLTNKP